MSASDVELNAFLQRKLTLLMMDKVKAVAAARWLDEAGLLADSSSRPGKPLRGLLRAGRTVSAQQRPASRHGRWFILASDPSAAPAAISDAVRPAAARGATSHARAVGQSRSRSCSHVEVQRARAALDRNAVKVAARDWPGQLDDLGQPGLYSWWVDVGGAEELSEGLGHRIPSGRIYAGQTGATKWPSAKRGSQTLSTRIGGNHLRGRIRGSTFRLSLAACLLRPLDLVKADSKRLDAPSEKRLSGWMREHLTVVVPFPDAGALGDSIIDVGPTLSRLIDPGSPKRGRFTPGRPR